jgi:hypothetical protein
VKFRPRSLADAAEAKSTARRDAEYFILLYIVMNVGNL